MRPATYPLAKGQGKTKIVARGKDENLLVPTLPLSQTPGDAIVQLITTTTICWEASYS